MKKHLKAITRRHFLTGNAAALANVSIVPRHVLGAPEIPPSEMIGAALIGPVSTMKISWDQPHEGNMFEFLYKRRSIKRAR